MFGYSKSELLGKTLDILMPEQYIKGHRHILLDKLNEYKRLNSSHHYKAYKSEFKDVFAFGKNKSRYLIPLNLKVSLVPFPDQNGVMFAAKIYNEAVSNNNQLVAQSCYVITNHKFYVNNISATCINVLGLTQNLISTSQLDITKYIKEFLEEIIRSDVESQNNAELEDKMNNDWNLFFNKYVLDNFKLPKRISFRRLDDKSKEDNEDIGSVFNSRKNQKRYSRVFNEKTDEVLNLSISELRIKVKLEGYIFKFETVGQSNNFSSSEITNSVENIAIKVDKNFIPESSQVFNIDAKKMAYLKNSNTDEMKKYIKDEAEKKIKLKKKDVDPTIEDGENSAVDGSQEYSDSGSENELEESSEELKSFTKRSDKSKKKIINDYYHVNMNNLKLLIYDHKSGIIREYTKDEFKVSQVEFKKNEDFRKSDSSEGKKVDDPGFEKENTVLHDENIETNASESILVKQIEYALSKEEKQPTIIKMKWISIIIFIIILILTCLFLGFFIFVQNDLILNFQMINYSFQLIYNTVIGVFHVKELTLLNNAKYFNYNENLDVYSKKSISILSDNYNNSHSLYTSIIASPLNITYTNQLRLYSEQIRINILDRNQNVKSITLTVSSAFIESNTALFHICNQDLSLINSQNEDVYFYLYNSQNSIMLSLFNQANVFLDVNNILC